MRAAFEVVPTATLTILSGVASETAVRVTVGIGQRIAPEITRKMPPAVTVRTTPGTVPGVTPMATREATPRSSVSVCYPLWRPMTRVSPIGLMREV